MNQPLLSSTRPFRWDDIEDEDNEHGKRGTGGADNKRGDDGKELSHEYGSPFRNPSNIPIDPELRGLPIEPQLIGQQLVDHSQAS